MRQPPSRGRRRQWPSRGPGHRGASHQADRVQPALVQHGAEVLGPHELAEGDLLLRDDAVLEGRVEGVEELLQARERGAVGALSWTVTGM